MSDPVPSKRVHGEAVLDDPLTLELLDARLVGVFATLNGDGTIHAVPMWFASHERSILLATGSRSAKVANIEVESRSTLVIPDSRPGYEVCGVSMVGDAEIVRGVSARPLVRHVHGATSTNRKMCPKPSRRSSSPTTLPSASAHTQHSRGTSARPKRTSHCGPQLVHFLSSRPTPGGEGGCVKARHLEPEAGDPT